MANESLKIVYGFGATGMFLPRSAKSDARSIRCSVARGRHHVHDAIAAPFERAQQGRQHARRSALLVSCSSTMPRPIRSIRPRMSCNSCSGVIGSQSLAQTSAPNTTMPRSVQPVEQRRAGGKSGKTEERRWSASAAAAPHRAPTRRSAMPRLISASALASRHAVEQRMRNSCDGRCCGLRPARGGRAPDASADIAAEQEEGGAHAFVLERVQHLRRGGPGQGPSSKVSTSSLGPSGSVVGNCLRPTRGVVAASTASTRSVPSACGLPGQGAAKAAKRQAKTAAMTSDAKHGRQLRPQLSAAGGNPDGAPAVYALIICPGPRGRAYKRRT